MLPASAADGLALDGGEDHVLDEQAFGRSLAELVQPFAKGAASHGSGLGLAIAAEVAGAHKGELTLAREDGMTPVRLVLAS